MILFVNSSANNYGNITRSQSNKVRYLEIIGIIFPTIQVIEVEFQPSLLTLYDFFFQIV